MYKAEPNNTKNQPNERPFLVRDSVTEKINRYCVDKSEAETQARRLNKVFYPDSLTDEENGEADPVEFRENLTLF